MADPQKPQPTNVLTLRAALTDQPGVKSPTTGETYPFKTRLMRDLVEIIALDQLNASIDSAIQAVGPSGPTAAEVQTIRGLLDQFCRKVVEAPDAFFADLDDLDRFDIRTFFMTLHKPNLPAAGADGPQGTGSTPLADSPASTPVLATPGIG